MAQLPRPKKQRSGGGGGGVKFKCKVAALCAACVMFGQLIDSRKTSDFQRVDNNEQKGMNILYMKTKYFND